MNHRRRHFRLIAMPDGKILAVGGDGGNETTGAGDCVNPVPEPEIYDPISDTWTDMAPMSEGRLYHSTATLLPDATILVAGGQCDEFDEFGQCDIFNHPQHTAEIYSPPYLFAGARPVITSVPGVIHYGSTFILTTPTQGISRWAIHRGAT